MAHNVLVVMNPSACDFAAQERWPSMEPLLRQGAQLTVVHTQADAEATRSAVTRALQAGTHDRVVAIGGDGTVQLVMECLLRAGLGVLPQFGVIPFGTANNVARALGLPLDDLDAMARIAVGDHLVGLDVCTLRMRHGGTWRDMVWTNCVSVGVDADVVAARGKWRGIGKWASYAAAMAERTLEQRSVDITLQVDARTVQDRVFNVVVTNVPIYAGALRMPGAVMDDGLLDAYLFDRNEYASKVMSFAAKKGDLLDLGVSEALESLTANQRAHHGKLITLRMAFPHHVQVDGEAVGQAEELELRCVARVQAAAG